MKRVCKERSDANYFIIGVDKGSHGVIAKCRVYKSTEDRNTTECMTREKIIELIKANKCFMTEDENGELGATVEISLCEKYLRTKGNDKLEDNLGELPPANC